jgi:hypothetical protein
MLVAGRALSAVRAGGLQHGWLEFFQRQARERKPPAADSPGAKLR